MVPKGFLPVTFLWCLDGVTRIQGERLSAVVTSNPDEKKAKREAGTSRSILEELCLPLFFLASLVLLVSFAFGILALSLLLLAGLALPLLAALAWTLALLLVLSLLLILPILTLILLVFVSSHSEITSSENARDGVGCPRFRRAMSQGLCKSRTASRAARKSRTCEWYGVPATRSCVRAPSLFFG